MIEGFFGLPGMGKTYLMSQRALAAMRRGRKVYANYPLQGAERYSDVSEVLDVQNALVLIDEAGVVVPAQMWRMLPAEVLVSWRQSRHDGVDIWYTAQDWQDVGTALRRITQFAHFIDRVWRIGHYTVRNPQHKKDDSYGFGWFLLTQRGFDAYSTTHKVGVQEYQRLAKKA